MSLFIFPSQTEIDAYLREHPATNTAYLREKREIIESIAKTFAEEEKFEEGIKMGVKLVMTDLNKKLKLPPFGQLTIEKCLVKALTDCANDTQNSCQNGDDQNTVCKEDHSKNSPKNSLQEDEKQLKKQKTEDVKAQEAEQTSYWIVKEYFDGIKHENYKMVHNFFPGVRDESYEAPETEKYQWRVIPDTRKLEELQNSTDVVGMIKLCGGNKEITVEGKDIYTTKEAAENAKNAVC